MWGWARRLGNRYLRMVGGSTLGRIYAAAKTTLGTGLWAPTDPPINDLTAADAETIRLRVRQLVRDMPHAARAVQVLTDLTVGAGIQVQPRVLDDNGRPIRTLNRAIEDAWKRWCDEADVAGRMHFGELQALAKRCEIETGESFLWFKESTVPGRLLPFAVQPIEPSALETYYSRQPALPGNEVSQGVEYDPRTYRPVAYYLSTDMGRRSALRVPADRLAHHFHTLRPGQLRGVSPLAPAVLLSHSLRDYLEAEIEAAQKAARWLAFVTTPNPADAMAAFGAAVDSDYTDSTGEHSKYVLDMGNAVVDFLKTGESVQIASHNRPGESFTPFTSWALQTFAALAGISYELLSGNYSGINYSTLRGIRNDLVKGIDVHQSRLIRQFNQPVYREFMRWAVLTGVLDIPDYFTNRWRYDRASWLGPGMAPVDPLKELRADADAVKRGLKSEIESIRSRGRDPEDVLDEREEFQRLLEERGLTIDAVSTAAQTNPAALEDNDAGAEQMNGSNPAVSDRALRRVK